MITDVRETSVETGGYNCRISVCNCRTSGYKVGSVVITEGPVSKVSGVVLLRRLHPGDGVEDVNILWPEVHYTQVMAFKTSPSVSRGVLHPCHGVQDFTNLCPEVHYTQVMASKTSSPCVQRFITLM